MALPSPIDHSRMPEISIESLVLQILGQPEFEARRIALEVVHQLADREELGRAPAEIPALRVEVPVRAHEDKSRLTDRIVGEIVREITRAS